MKLDCLGNRIIVTLFLSERDAQLIAGKLRQNDSRPAIMRHFITLLSSRGEFPMPW